MLEAKIILVLGAILLVFVASIVFLVREVLFTARRTRAFFASAPLAKEIEPAGNPFIESRLVQRFLALGLAGLGAYGTVRLWREAIRGNEVQPTSALLFPFFAVLGVGCFIFPLDFDAQRWKYGRSRPRTWEETPPAMKVAIVLGLLASVANYLYFLSR